ncbi:hypothetical protein [Lacinutrix salivirga]
MKNLIYLFCLVLSFSCSNNDDKPENNVPQELIGKWKLIEIYASDGNSNSWVPYDSGESYDIWFKEDLGLVVSTMVEGCQIGSFSISSNNEIVYNLPCSEQSIIPIESLSETTLITDVTYIEYELNKYEKITE